VVVNKGRYFVRHNTMQEDVLVPIMLRAMGVESDEEMVQLVGTEDFVVSALMASIEDASKLDIYTQEQAWKFIGTKLRVKRFGPWAGANAKKRPVEDEVRELLASTILPNVAVSILLYDEGFARI
jgi:DNA-directed RNA polymerase III subunit RPC2